MRLVFISDTHLQHAFNVPDGDVLVHCGDGTSKGTLPEIKLWNAWFQNQPHRHKIAIAGNHDFGFEQTPEAVREVFTAAVYLQDSSITIEGVKIYGSPWQPWFGGWAFNLPRGGELREQWNLIPDDVDVLVTHGPPHEILDQTLLTEHVGCEELRKVVERIQPKIHAFGHIHCAHGTEKRGKTLFVNACICTESYDPWQAPVVVDLFARGAVVVED